MAQIYPSLISADILNLKTVIKELEPHCAGFHIDIMDGHFVPNITWGPAFANAITAHTTKTSWVHLMVTDPKTWIKRLELPAQSMVDFHIETDINHKALLEHIRAQTWRAGIAISPKTAVEKIVPLLEYLDYVLVMSVKPGFSGQAFMPSALNKVKLLGEIRTQKNLNFEIAIDGGINAQNIREVVAAGAQHIAAASAIFKSNNPIIALEKLSSP